MAGSLTCRLCFVRSTDKNPTKTTRIIKIVVIGATIVITLAAMRYINAKIEGVKHRVIYARRKARQAKLPGSSSSALSIKRSPGLPRPCQLLLSPLPSLRSAFSSLSLSFPFSRLSLSEHTLLVF